MAAVGAHRDPVCARLWVGWRWAISKMGGGHIPHLLYTPSRTASPLKGTPKRVRTLSVRRTPPKVRELASSTWRTAPRLRAAACALLARSRSPSPTSSVPPSAAPSAASAPRRAPSGNPPAFPVTWGPTLVRWGAPTAGAVNWGATRMPRGHPTASCVAAGITRPRAGVYKPTRARSGSRWMAPRRRVFAGAWRAGT